MYLYVFLYISFSCYCFLSTILKLTYLLLLLLSCFSCVLLFVTQWTVACRSPLSRGFSKQEYWSGLPCPPSAYLPKAGIEPMSLISALAGVFCATWEAPNLPYPYFITTLSSSFKMIIFKSLNLLFHFHISHCLVHMY